MKGGKKTNWPYVFYRKEHVEFYLELLRGQASKTIGYTPPSGITVTDELKLLRELLYPEEEES